MPLLCLPSDIVALEPIWQGVQVFATRVLGLTFVSKTVNGVTRSYATTDINPTGYSQVAGESYSPRLNGTESQHSSIYGIGRGAGTAVALRRVGNKLTQQTYFVHDGHGSVRAIIDLHSNCGINSLPFSLCAPVTLWQILLGLGVDLPGNSGPPPRIPLYIG